LENAQELVGGKPVFGIVSKPRLQAALQFVPKSASAIDKPFFDPRHFGHVRLGWDFRSGRQSEAEVLACMFRQQFFKFGEEHGLMLVG
jgi:hypothetical protein